MAILGNFINRAVVLTHKYFEGVLPARKELQKVDKEIISELNSYPERIAKSLEAFKFREALTIYLDLARMGNK